jgi:hypothetical protein
MATAASIVIAGIAAFASGLGSNLAKDVTVSSQPLLSYSAAEVHEECWPTFLPREEALEVLHQSVPKDWGLIMDRPEAAFVGRDTAELAVQGESSRTVTLTGIEFQVTRHPIPRGGSFAQQCGGPGFGRSIRVDLDQHPPRVVSSNRDTESIIGSELNAQGRPTPIRFPWTVSLTDPLLLFVEAEAKSCYCEWSARIPWVSGSQRGTINLDEGHGGFRVVGKRGFPQYSPSPGYSGPHWARSRYP